jgi:hypothetical protein
MNREGAKKDDPRSDTKGPEGKSATDLDAMLAGFSGFKLGERAAPGISWQRIWKLLRV